MIHGTGNLVYDQCEIMDTLQDVELNPDQIDEIYESFLQWELM